MFEFARIIGFDWDDGNRRKSEDKHGVGQGETEQVFFNEPLLVSDDTGHSSDESRFHALGKSNASRCLHLTFTLRAASTKIRVISARDMNRKERERYEKES